MMFKSYKSVPLTRKNSEGKENIKTNEMKPKKPKEGA